MGIVRKEDIHSSFDDYIRDMHSNPNLLINGDVQVWQRGITFGNSYNDYTADRWLKRTVGTVEKVNSGIKISRKSNEEGTYIRQYMESNYLYNLKGKTLTLSCEIGDIVGTAGLMFYVNGGTRLGIKNFTTTGIHSITFTIPQDIDLSLKMMPQISLNNNPSQDTYVVINWIKLEIGNKPTPFVPRLCGEELALCKRYGEPIRTIPQPVSRNTIDLIYKVEKRIIPTLKIKSMNGVDNKVSFWHSNNATWYDLNVFNTDWSNPDMAKIAFDREDFTGDLFINFTGFADSEIY